ncbi:MAG: hypothetical protein IJC07_03060 [Clostridia bacterium]|nr:hypothetical protein [Clostridia bacterium]
MKVNKLIFITSIIVSLFSIGCYLFFVFYFENPIVMGKEIAMAIFGSSFFVIMTAIIGYFTEKNKLKENILSNSDFYIGLYLLEEIDCNNAINRQSFAKMISASRNKILLLKKFLVEYYHGCFFKCTQNNKILLKIINISSQEYYKNLVKFEMYLGSPKPNFEILKQKFFNLIEQGKKLDEELGSWMRKIKVNLGDEFDFGEDFITNYEEDEQL